MSTNSFLVSNSVINKIKALPGEMRQAISVALANEFILGEDPRNTLSPTQMVLYTFIKFDIQRDTLKL